MNYSSWLFLTVPTQKPLNQLLVFLACKKSIYSMLFFRYSQFYSPLNRLVRPIFDHAVPDQLWIFVNLYQHAKNQSIPYVHSSDTVNSRVPSPDWPHPFFSMPIPKFLIILYFAWIFTSMQYIRSLYLLILEIQVKSLRQSQEKESEPRDQIGLTQNFKLKKPDFWPVSPIFGL